MKLKYLANRCFKPTTRPARGIVPSRKEKAMKVYEIYNYSVTHRTTDTDYTEADWLQWISESQHDDYFGIEPKRFNSYDEAYAVFKDLSSDVNVQKTPTGYQYELDVFELAEITLDEDGDEEEYKMLEIASF